MKAEKVERAQKVERILHLLALARRRPRPRRRLLLLADDGEGEERGKGGGEVCFGEEENFLPVMGSHSNEPRRVKKKKRRKGEGEREVLRAKKGLPIDRGGRVKSESSSS